jgi:hypothetical protein
MTGEPFAGNEKTGKLHSSEAAGFGVKFMTDGVVLPRRMAIFRA